MFSAVTVAAAEERLAYLLAHAGDEKRREILGHILNEMLDSAEDFEKLPVRIAFILRGKDALQNEKLRSVLKRFPAIRVFYDSMDSNVEALARRLYVDPEKLPLIAVAASELTIVYASSGYNVGCASMLVRICHSIG